MRDHQIFLNNTNKAIGIIIYVPPLSALDTHNWIKNVVLYRVLLYSDYCCLVPKPL